MALTKPKPAKERIVALDVLRGLFLIVIMINHVELYPSGFDYFTGRGRLLVSAAEGFFFMSGLLVGLVYRRRIAHGLRFIFKKMWLRAAELYVGSVALTLLFTVAAIYLGHTNIKQGLWYPVNNWWHLVGQSFLMTYNFGWADFLYRFALMMLAAPFAFYLLAKKKWWLLAGLSILVWAAPGNNDPWDTLNWQIFFMGGMILGFHWQQVQAWWAQVSEMRRKLIKRSVIGISAVTFALSYASVYVLSELNGHFNDLGADLQQLTLHWNSTNTWVWNYAQKWTEGPVRIVLFGFWFWCLFMLVQKYYPHIRRLSRGTVEMLGQNSLYVYITHAFIVFTFKLFIPLRTNLLQNFVITAGALGLLIVLTRLYVHHRPKLSVHKANLAQKLPWIPANIES